MTALKKYPIPYVKDAISGKVAIRQKHETLLRDLSVEFGKDIPPIKTQADLGLALLSAWIGGSLRKMKSNTQ